MSAVAHITPRYSFTAIIKNDEQLAAERRATQNTIIVSRFQSGLRFCNQEQMLLLHNILAEQAECDADSKALLEHIMMETLS